MHLSGSPFILGITEDKSMAKQKLMNLYLIRLFNERENFYKIGTTVHKYCRFYEIMKSGYSVEIVFMIHGLTWETALKAEKTMHMFWDKYEPLEKFGGYTECFKNINERHYKLRVGDLIDNYSYITENKTISWR
jgi:hypothetical protein